MAHPFSSAEVSIAKDRHLLQQDFPADGPDFDVAPRGKRQLRCLEASLDLGEVTGSDQERLGRPAGATRPWGRGDGRRRRSHRARFDQHARGVAESVGRASHEFVVSPAYQQRRAVCGPDGYIPQLVVVCRASLEEREALRRKGSVAK